MQPRGFHLMDKFLYLIIIHLVCHESKGMTSFGAKGHLVPPCAEPEAEKDTAEDKSAVNAGFGFRVANAEDAQQKGEGRENKIKDVADICMLDGGDILQENSDPIGPTPFPAGHVDPQVSENDLVII